MANCSNLSNTQSVTLQAGVLPVGFCHTTLQGTLDAFISNTTGQLGGNVAAFTAGDSTPSAQDRSKLWFSLTSECKPGGWKWYNSTTAAWEYVQITTEQATALAYPPVGMISAYGGASAPAGWLICHGGTASRVLYPALFTAIGTAYGVGDNSSTFGIPDLRGEFLRGLDAGRGVDVDRALGSSQADDFKGHTHPIHAFGTSAPSNGWGIIGGANGYDAGHTYTDVRVNAWEPTIAKTGGTETRPRNVSVNYIIKH